MNRQITIIFAPRGDNVAERWRAQYQTPDGKWKYTNSGDSEIMYKKLLALGPDPSPSEIAQTVGNTSWAPGVECDCCGSREDKVIQLKPDYSSGIKVCLICLEEAASMLSNVRAR